MPVTMENTKIQRLDFSKSPRGYLVWYDDEWQCFCFGIDDDGLSLNPEPIETEAEAIAAAWAHYKALHDPPGIEVICESPGKHRWYQNLSNEAKAEARAAAWAWYERRVALMKLFELAAQSVAEAAISLDHDTIAWPDILAWSDDAVAGAERELAEMIRLGAERRLEVLRG